MGEQARMLLTEFEFEESALDTLVQDAALNMAASLNNNGVEDQIEFLVEQGFSLEEITARGRRRSPENRLLAMNDEDCEWLAMTLGHLQMDTVNEATARMVDRMLQKIETSAARQTLADAMGLESEKARAEAERIQRGMGGH